MFWKHSMILAYVDCLGNSKKYGEYVLAQILSILGVPFAFSHDHREPFHIYYGMNRSLAEKAAISIPADNYDEWFRRRPLFAWVDDIPILYLTEKPRNVVVRKDNTSVFQFDLVAVSFYLLARIEEIADSRRDQWNCFSGKYSLLYETGALDVPIVDCYCLLLGNLLKETFPNEVSEDKRAKWKNDRKFAVALTHDVDIPLKGYRGTIGRMFRENKLMSTVPVRDPYWHFDSWISLEREHGFRSAFYFYAGSGTHPYDPRYDIKNPIFAKVIHKIDDSGWEIGLHGSYDSYNHGGLLLKEKKKLEQVTGKKIEGVRQHYLRFDIRSTWNEQSNAGFLYDATLGYNEAPGFRAGIGHPFKPFLLDSLQTPPIMELPLSVMDAALFDDSAGDAERATRRCLAIIENTERWGGCASLLWHQRAWCEKDYPKWRDVYERILHHLEKRDAWVTSPIEIVKWHAQRYSCDQGRLP